MGMRSSPELLDQRQDFKRPLLIERRQRFVHQEDLRRGKQRPAERHPLLLPSRESRRLARQQRADAKRLDHGFEGNPPFRARREPSPEQQILPDAEMREKLAVLEHEPDASPIFRHIHPRLDVDQCAFVEHDASSIGSRQPGDQIDGGRLARPRPAEQGGDAVVVLEGNIEIEIAEPESGVDADHASKAMRSSSPAIVAG